MKLQNKTWKSSRDLNTFQPIVPFSMFFLHVHVLFIKPRPAAAAAAAAAAAQGVSWPASGLEMEDGGNGSGREEGMNEECKIASFNVQGKACSLSSTSASYSDFQFLRDTCWLKVCTSSFMDQPKQELSQQIRENRINKVCNFYLICEHKQVI